MTTIACMPPTHEALRRHLQPVEMAVTSLLRIGRLPTGEPRWSQGQCRFDGPHQGPFATCYAASRLDVAFAESVVHGSAAYNRERDCYEVASASLRSRWVLGLERRTGPTLTLADLRGAALKRLGGDNDLSAGSDYSRTMTWAQAIYDCHEKWDGIVYVSRQFNSELVVAIFNRRPGLAVRECRPLEGQELAQLCLDFGVVEV